MAEMFRRAVSLLAALLLLPVAAQAAPARDWSKVVALSPTGSFVQGNPKAKVRVIEYASYTCPHCGVLARDAIVQLEAHYVKTGQVSYEFRNAVRDRYDYVAALLARCAGPKGFFPVSAAIFATQEQWFGTALTFDSGPAGDVGSLPDADKPVALAKGAGLDAVAARQGIAADRQRVCLNDQAQMNIVGKMSDEAWRERKIPGTPYILINDVPAEHVADWPTLQARIDEALKQK